MMNVDLKSKTKIKEKSVPKYFLISKYERLGD